MHALSTHGAVLSGPVALLGFTCWNAHRTSSSLVLSLWKSSSSADTLFKISWICLCFCKKSWQSKWLKNWFSSLTSPALFTEAIFCVLPFTYKSTHQLHTTPHSSHIYYIYVKLLPFLFYFIYTVPFLYELPLSVPFAHYSSLSFFWNRSFFLLMMPLILLIIKGLLWRNIFTVFCVIVHSIQQGMTITFFPTCPVGQVDEFYTCLSGKTSCPWEILKINYFD